MAYKIDQIDIGLIKLNDNNPRFIKDREFESLVQSLKECPELFNARPLLCNKDLTVLGGNMRYRAAKQLNYKKVPVIVMHDITPEQEQEVLIKDNGSWGQWDLDVLGNEYSHLPLSDWGAPDGWQEEEHSEEKEIDFKSKFEVVAECMDEKDQESLYNKLIELGYSCRILTL